jgi:hypothetical protein
MAQTTSSARRASRGSERRDDTRHIARRCGNNAAWGASLSIRGFFEAFFIVEIIVSYRILLLD